MISVYLYLLNRTSVVQQDEIYQTRRKLLNRMIVANRILNRSNQIYRSYAAQLTAVQQIAFVCPTDDDVLYPVFEKMKK